jgi:hypothetical protein
MTPEQLAGLLTEMATAADVVESLEDRDLQRRRGWDLDGWRYQLVPWGVRFTRDAPARDGAADVLVLTGLGGTRVIVQFPSLHH